MELEQDDNTEEILAGKRHKELMKAISKIANIKLESPPIVQDTSVADAISKHMKTIEGLVSKLKPQEIPPPIVNVKTDNSAIIAQMSNIADRISSSLSELKKVMVVSPVEKQKTWTFTVTRNNAGVIQTITAKAT